MANPRELTKRRKASRNIRKITRTMQLIATSRFQKALTQATASKPYAERITELVSELSSAGSASDHPLLRKNADAKKSVLLVITSNRGLCGGYNSGLLRLTQEKLQSLAGPVELHMVGKKGVGYFKFLGREMARQVTDFPDTPQFSDVDPFASEFMERYSTGEYSAVHVVFMQFISAAKQVPTCIQLLPLSKDDEDGSESEASSSSTSETQYDFSPNPEQLLAELLPVTVKIRMFQCFTEANVSEQVSRMVAMKAATDAADDMIKMLSRQYNRARQSQITNELLDIIGGAEAIA